MSERCGIVGEEVRVSVSDLNQHDEYDRGHEDVWHDDAYALDPYNRKINNEEERHYEDEEWEDMVRTLDPREVWATFWEEFQEHTWPTPRRRLIH